MIYPKKAVYLKDINLNSRGNHRFQKMRASLHGAHRITPSFGALCAPNSLASRANKYLGFHIVLD